MLQKYVVTLGLILKDQKELIVDMYSENVKYN